MLRRLLANPHFRIDQNKFYRRLNSNDSNNNTSHDSITLNAYHEASDNKLEELSDKLETALEDRYDKGADVSLSNGVLTVVVDQDNTYVLNKQTPNRQIWLSSPISGPKRFDFISGKWMDKYDKTELEGLLSKELSQLLKNKIEF